MEAAWTDDGLTVNCGRAGLYHCCLSSTHLHDAFKYFAIVVAKGQGGQRHDLRDSTEGKHLWVPQLCHVLDAMGRMLQCIGDHMVQTLYSFFPADVSLALTFASLWSKAWPVRLSRSTNHTTRRARPRQANHGEEILFCVLDATSQSK